jgi:transposase
MSRSSDGWYFLHSQAWCTLLTDCTLLTALLFNLHRARRRVRRAWADSVYAGKLQSWAATYLNLTVEIVKRPDNLHTFEVLPRRWVVERTLAWISSYRRCVRGYERLPAHHEAAVYWAMTILMTRRLTRAG